MGCTCSPMLKIQQRFTTPPFKLGNYISLFYTEFITYLCPNPDCDLVKSINPTISLCLWNRATNDGSSITISVEAISVKRLTGLVLNSWSNMIINCTLRILRYYSKCIQQLNTLWHAKLKCFINTLWLAHWSLNKMGAIGLLPDTENCRLLMRRECRERFPHHRHQWKPLIRDPGMHHGTCVTHVPWCMSGSLTCGGMENVPGTPGACATRNFPYLVRGSLYRSSNAFPWMQVSVVCLELHRDSFPRSVFQ